MGTERISTLMARVADLAVALGVRNIHERPGCWEHTVDARWWIATNGHKQPTKCSAGVAVPPFHCYVQYNGWPAGMFSPFGGTVAHGEAANEDALIAALDAATMAVGGALTPDMTTRRTTP